MKQEAYKGRSALEEKVYGVRLYIIRAAIPGIKKYFAIGNRNKAYW